jgi:tight adherence protein B
LAGVEGMKVADAVYAAAAASLAVVVVAARGSARVPVPRPPATGLDAPGRSLRIRRRRPNPVPRPDDVADWCDLVARSLRSGSSLTAAVAEGATAESPMAGVVAPVVRQVGRGESLVSALDGAGVDPASAAGLALAVVRACACFGGPAAAPLERAAATLRAREAVAAEQRAQCAQALLSARVLTLVPLALLALLATTDAKVRTAVTTPAGATAVVLGAALNATGGLWMRRIIGRPR